MSRIHDALKKAEQKRIEDALADPTVPANQPPAPPHGQPPTLPPAVAADSASPGICVSGVSPTALEAHKLLLERCNRCLWTPDPETMLFLNRRNPVAGVEEFRTLRSHLSLIREQQRLQKILITSPTPLDGKTFVAVNLAQAIVWQPEKRALLIDVDLRLSGLHQYLGAPLAPGVSDYLNGQADEFSILQSGLLDNLFFIPGGKPVPNASELIGNGRLRLLIERLAPAFDWIILDSPPVIPVSDATLLADLCDGVLMVIQAGATRFDLAQKACKGLREKHLLGVVLNRVDPDEAYGTRYNGKPKLKNKITMVEGDTNR